MKRKIFLFITLISIFMFSSCGPQADRVKHNLTQQADNFNNYRQITVINCLTGDTLFQMTGKCSITADTSDNQLEIIVECEDKTYKKHIIGLSDNVTYVVEDITSSDVSQYKYELNFNPKMWLPYKVETID